MQEVAWIALPLVFFILGMPIYQTISHYRKGRIVQVRIIRWWIICTIMLCFSLLSALLFGFACGWISRFPMKTTRHILPCKVVSKGVDLRWAKVCGTGDLSPTSLKMFGIPDVSKFRCSLDYYWVSTLRLEFEPDHSNGVVQAAAELPAEVLPGKCRPHFAAVWKTTENIQVNGTLLCSYPGKTHTLDVEGVPYRDCVPDSPSSLKLFRDYLIIVFSSYRVHQSTSDGVHFWKWIYALAASLCFSMIVTAITKTMSWFHFKVFDSGNSSFVNVLVYELRFQISCLICATTLALVFSASDFEALRSGYQILKDELQSRFRINS